MSLQVGETDSQGRTLIVGGWKADLFATSEGYEILGQQIPSGIEALRVYNEQNHTQLKPEFFDKWLAWYQELSKNVLTGTRVGPDNEVYFEEQRVREYMKRHPEVVEKVRRENGLT